MGVGKGSTGREYISVYYIYFMCVCVLCVCTASGPITLWQIEREKVETGTDFKLGLQNHCKQ